MYTLANTKQVGVQEFQIKHSQADPTYRQTLLIGRTMIYLMDKKCDWHYHGDINESKK